MRGLAKRRAIVTGGASGIGQATASAAPQEKKPPAPVNQTCPVNAAGLDAKYTVVVQGKLIGFCSRGTSTFVKRVQGKFSIHDACEATASIASTCAQTFGALHQL